MSARADCHVPIWRSCPSVRIRPEEHRTGQPQNSLCCPLTSAFRGLRERHPILVRECSLTIWSDCVPIHNVPPPTVAVHHRELPDDHPPGARANRGKRKRESAHHREAVLGGLSSSTSAVPDSGPPHAGCGPRAGSDPDEFRQELREFRRPILGPGPRATRRSDGHGEDRATWDHTHGKRGESE
jgi:hypothetical protein